MSRKARGVAFYNFAKLCYAKQASSTSKRRILKITTENIIFWLILDPITFGLGSIGAYILFRQFVENERFPKRDEWWPVIKQHWFALLSLGLAIGYFFYRLIYVLNGK